MPFARGGGTIATAHPAAQDGLRRAIGLACRFRQAISIALPQPEAPPLLGLVMPIESNALASVAQPLAERALLLVRHPARSPRPRAAALRQVFGLTAPEAALTEALAAGSDLRDIAEARRITYATLRAQLRSVMAKTGTRRQGELIALAHRTTALDLGGDGFPGHSTEEKTPRSSPRSPS